MKIFLDSIGCRLNQSEIEKMALQFQAAGHELVDSAVKADVVVVNTCAVTVAAASDSRGKIRHAAREGHARVIATGCWATLDPQAALQLPGVVEVVSNLEKDTLVSNLLEIPQTDFELEPIQRMHFAGVPLRTRAFIKAQDGCDNLCTFCITRLARGSAHSRPARQVLQDVQAAFSGGALEAILTGVQLGSWGKENFPRQHLDDLVRLVLKESSIPRVRLSSVEPWELGEGFLEIWKDGRVCRQLHLPLQAGSSGVLHRMARKTTPAAYAVLVRKAREICPEIAITTDLIAGFPGESEAEFEEGLQFIQQINFAEAHIFTYSLRPGTAAAQMKQITSREIRKQRAARLREVVQTSARHYRSTFIGKTLPVLWESAAELGLQGWRLSGWSDNYIRVEVVASEKLWNTISSVRVEGLTNEGVHGVILAD